MSKLPQFLISKQIVDTLKQNNSKYLIRQSQAGMLRMLDSYEPYKGQTKWDKRRGTFQFRYFFRWS